MNNLRADHTEDIDFNERIHNKLAIKATPLKFLIFSGMSNAWFQYSITVPEDNPEKDVFFHICELLFLICGVISSAILLRYLRSTKAFHRNFREILTVLLVISIYHAFTRTLVLIFEIIDAHVYMKIISHIEAALVLASDLSVPLGTSAYLILVCERFVATMYVETYEGRFKSHFVTTLIWAIPIAAAIILEFLFLTIYDILYKLLIPLSILTAMDALSILLGACVFYKNKKIYKEAFISGTHGLTARYQTSENIKTTRLITPVLALQFSANIFLAAATYYIVIFLNYQTSEKADFFSHIFAMLIAILITVSPWIILLRYPPYRNRIKRHKVSPGRFDPPIIKNVNGIMIAANQSAKEHFEQLQKSWS